MKFHSTVIFVKEIRQSIDFYTRYLDFSIEHDFGKNVILNNGVTIWEIMDNHLITKHLETRNESNRFELYFESEDIDAKCKILVKAGVKFLPT
jgi:catechol 2,3-dioxygenase-like lactoylglutathione lyase family enzyme